MHNWDSLWTTDGDSTPSEHHRYMTEVNRWYAACWRAGLSVQGVAPGDSLDGFDVILAPGLHVVTDAEIANITKAVESGAHAVITYFSGTVDELDHVRLGGYPGGFAELLGVHFDEFAPLLPGQTAALRSTSERIQLAGNASGSIWTERGRADDGTEVLADYADGPSQGSPAMTRRTVGNGSAWYVSTSPDDASIDSLIAALSDDSGVRPTVPGLPEGVDAVRRVGEQASYLFVLNHRPRGCRAGRRSRPHHRNRVNRWLFAAAVSWWRRCSSRRKHLMSALAKQRQHQILEKMRREERCE
ncbi:beta-galactosidase trimerization domain-containing protein [Ornithinimicrobium sp. INDO-MA30-4]|uniref:beta-galactosidase n=1 Tax=Ornithinimicrobium sp. INDO-MA30-4 TaxID=2908651 RepID=UPI001F23FD65|nr:beta-galactosidase trimerization domain-containing protein [Ornithinimicrobium sp. INDO-MA30-4]UJH71646.1 beta-galactosidase trimerization domain-containing protein [Ornithinimicrobium sp. INDO-MA30-4]